MKTETVFENITERIEQEIRKAQKSIFIAVTWFTNKSIFNELMLKTRAGCTVSLIISDDNINLNSSIDFDKLIIGKSNVYKIKNANTELILNKFCIIDYDTVITGLHNWTYKSENYFENVIITNNDKKLAQQFISEFNTIRKKYYPGEKNEENIFPLNEILIRLDILKNYILLKDIKELDKETLKLKEYDYNLDLLEIIKEIKSEKFGSVINKIQNFISKNKQLLVWENLENEAIKLEIKNLENKLYGHDYEKIELEKLLSDFQHRHTIELGEIILDILKLHKLKFKADKTKCEEAGNDERQYQDYFEAEKKNENEIFKLTDEQKLELKRKFKKAAVLCHPDKFVNESIEIQKQAEEIFKELIDTNVKNDLVRVSEVLANLEKGFLSTSKGDKLTDINKLRATANRLRIKVKKLKDEIIMIKESETYKTIINIESWDDYFSETKEKLKEELEHLKLRIDD
jgi:hypothetical protein